MKKLIAISDGKVISIYSSRFDERKTLWLGLLEFCDEYFYEEDKVDPYNPHNTNWKDWAAISYRIHHTTDDLADILSEYFPGWSMTIDSNQMVQNGELVWDPPNFD